MVEGVKTEQTVQNIKKVKKESKKKNPGKIRECKQCPGLQFLKLKVCLIISLYITWRLLVDELCKTCHCYIIL